VKRYHYDSTGRLGYIEVEANQRDSGTYWCKVFEYDLNDRIKVTISLNNGKTRSLKKWEWNDEGNELKIYSKDHRGRKNVEFFRYDEKNRLIEYSDNLNDKTLRIYKMEYYENNLIKELITLAPNDDWTHIKSYQYSFE